MNPKLKIKKNVFIVWTPFTPRAAVLAERLNSKVFFIDHLIKSRGIFWKLFWWIDYIYKSLVTIFFLATHKPEIVFAQSPPSFSPIICFLYCLISRKKLVIDCHDSTFEWPWISIPLFKYVLEFSSSVIVHNEELGSFLMNKYPKIPFLILNDKLKDFGPPTGNVDVRSDKYLLGVLVYDRDEPFVELLEAFKQFLEENNSDISLKLTGNYRKISDVYEKYKDVDGIDFLGFIPRDEYEEILKNAYGVIALTKKSMKQSCAIAEAVGSNTPIITSDTDTNKNLLFEGAIFSSVDVTNIKKAITEFIIKRSSLAIGIRKVRACWEERWEKSFAEMIAKLL